MQVLPSETERPYSAAFDKLNISRHSLAETVSVGDSDGGREELYFCDACHECDDVCANLKCQDCKDKRKKTNIDKKYTMCQIRRHDTEESCWLVVGSSIYDASNYIKSHPGGSYSILRKGGGVEDCTEDLMFHSKTGRQAWKRLRIGEVCSCKNFPVNETGKCFNFFGFNK